MPSQAPKSSVLLAFDTLESMLRFGVAPSELADWLIGQGRHFITTVDAAEVLGVDVTSVSASLERPRRAGKLVSVTKQGWVPVPPEFRSAGAPPASHFIHPLMEHLGHFYYVGFLSAAAILGASHQAPMVFQVVTPARLRSRKIGRGRIHFIQRAAAVKRPRQHRSVPTGRVWISTPEVTVFDLVDSPEDGAGLSNVATVVGCLLMDGCLDPFLLVSIAAEYPMATTQRCGYVIDFMAAETGVQFDTSSLHELVVDSRYRELFPGGGDGHRNSRWNILVNGEIEHDL